MARLSMGEFLASLRKQKGYTQQEVADILDVSNRTVSAWEKDKAMPDILLLPAIAELYEVTTDELLSGTRKDSQSDAPIFSVQAERSILLKKLSRFTLQSYILLGVSILGQLFTFWGWYNVLFTFTETDKFNWWHLAMILGIVAVIVVFAVLFALWKSCESSVDSSLKGSNEFHVALSQRVITHFIVAAGIDFVFGFAMLVFYAIGVPVIHMSTTYIVFFIAFSIVGTLLYNHKINTLATVSRLKQSRLIMICYISAALLFSVIVFTAIGLNINVKSDGDIALLHAFLSFALLLTGTLLYNTKLPKQTKENVAFFVKMSYSMTICFYVLAALYCLLAIISMIFSRWTTVEFLLLATLIIFSITALLLGWLLHRRNLINWCGEDMHACIKRNEKLYRKVFLWGLIPFFVGVVVVIITLVLWDAIYDIVLLLIWGSITMILLDIAVCFAICLLKREKTAVKQ